MRTTAFVLFISMFAAATAAAQDRGVSVPDVYTPDATDAFAAQEVTAALRIAGGMMPEWRLSTVDVPLVELMRACGASSDTSASEECMARMVVTRDPSMAGGFILFAFMERVGEANGYRIILVLYDMREARIMSRIEAPAARIMAPAARNREAAEWIRRLLEPPRPLEVAEADEPSIVATDPEPVAPTEEVPIEPPRSVTDFTGIDVASWTMIGLAVASAVAAGITGGLVLSMNGDARYNAYRETWDASIVPDVCRAAEGDPSDDGRYVLGVCRDAGALEIATHVLWAGVGVLGVAGALTFLIPRVGASDPQVEATLIPSIAPTRAGLDLRVTF